MFAPELVAPGESFPKSSFHLLPEWEQRSFWFRSRNKLVIWALQRYLPHARNFLEVGCGTGFVLQGLRAARPELELTAAELFVEGLEVTRERVPDATLIQADARRLPFRDEFDVVGAFDVLEHVGRTSRRSVSFTGRSRREAVSSSRSRSTRRSGVPPTSSVTTSGATREASSSASSDARDSRSLESPRS